MRDRRASLPKVPLYVASNEASPHPALRPRGDQTSPLELTTLLVTLCSRTWQRQVAGFNAMRGEGTGRSSGHLQDVRALDCVKLRPVCRQTFLAQRSLICLLVVARSAFWCWLEVEREFVTIPTHGFEVRPAVSSLSLRMAMGETRLWLLPSLLPERNTSMSLHCKQSVCARPARISSSSGRSISCGSATLRFRKLCLLLLVPVVFTGFAVTLVSAADRPNIVFLFTDDHAPHAIGAYNGWLKDVNPTPNIDKLAARGMLFENSFCTNSICGPSRAVILTGKHSHVNGFMNNGNRFNGDQQTFPKLLQKGGYSTAMIGKWHLHTDPQGFDYWQVLPGQGDYYNPFFKTAKGRVQIEGYCTDIVTDLALDWLKEQKDSDKPFMLMCQHKAPHRCWMPPLRHLTLYDDVDIPEAPTLFDKWTDNASPARFQEMEIDRHLHLVGDCFGPMPDGFDINSAKTDRSGIKNMMRMTPEQREVWDAAYGPKNAALLKAKLTGDDLVRWKYNRYIRNYLRCIKGVDESLGRLTAYLEEAGLADNTIVIYSSDQGFYLGDHGWYDKRWMYEESLKMPLIVKWPGVTKGTRNTDLVQNLDYGETFLDIAGLEIPSDMQGRSLVPILKGETPADWRKGIYYHYYEYPSVHMVARHYGIRTDRYKLIRFYQFDEWEFYDLEKDPEELTNQYNNAAYADVISTMKKDLDALREHYKDDSDVKVMPPEWRQKFRTASVNK